ncbi:hypothetical protein CWI36_3386p0020, partial [Hamiltosporidium magnivora]
VTTPAQPITTPAQPITNPVTTPAQPITTPITTPGQPINTPKQPPQPINIPKQPGQPIAEKQKKLSKPEKAEESSEKVKKKGEWDIGKVVLIIILSVSSLVAVSGLGYWIYITHIK